MTMRSIRSDGLPISSDAEGLRPFIKRHLGLLVGTALIGGTAAVAVALATWTVDDPSLSYAVAKPVSNALGLPGAIIADATGKCYWVDKQGQKHYVACR